jgi:hypothetical protein
MSDTLKQIILPRRPVRQPQPTIVSGGDCGACVLAGLTGVSVEEAYDRFHQPGEYLGGKPIEKRSSLSDTSMKVSLELLMSDSGCRGGCADIPVLLDHVVTDIPIWPFGHARHYLCWGLRTQLEWREYARAMLNGGYYGVAQVAHGGLDPDGPLRKFGWTDHWVMICGWRYRYEVDQHDEERRKAGLGSYHEDILIGDSSLARPHECWVDVNDFQSYWGGFATFWAKPL